MDRTVVYTDGACRGNPGPGGWGFVVPAGQWASGYDQHTTNQRMELQAVLAALRLIEGPVEVFSDSTYVVHCFRDSWWVGWRKRGWKNSKKEPIANRDLWEPLIDLVRARIDEIEFTWVKAHSGDEWNEVADRLAVEASHAGQGSEGVGMPEALGVADVIAPHGSGEPSVPATAKPGSDGVYSSTWRPTGPTVLVTGLQPPGLGGYDANPVSDDVRRRLTEILVAKAKVTPGLIVLTGLRLGAETLAAEAAVEAGIPFAAILPFPIPESRWPPKSQQRFHELLGKADTVVRLGSKAPADGRAIAQSLERRNGWMRKIASEAVVVWDREESRVGKFVASLETELPDDVWILDV